MLNRQSSLRPRAQARQQSATTRVRVNALGARLGTNLSRAVSGFWAKFLKRGCNRGLWTARNCVVRPSIQRIWAVLHRASLLRRTCSRSRPRVLEPRDVRSCVTLRSVLYQRCSHKLTGGLLLVQVRRPRLQKARGEIAGALNTYALSVSSCSHACHRERGAFALRTLDRPIRALTGALLCSWSSRASRNA